MTVGSCTSSTSRVACTTFEAIVIIAAVGAIAIGIISLLGNYNVLSDSYALINKTWSHVCWAAGLGALLILGFLPTQMGGGRATGFLGSAPPQTGGGSGEHARVEPDLANTKAEDEI